MSGLVDSNNSAPDDPESTRLRDAASAAIADVDALELPNGSDRQIALAVLLAARVGLGVPGTAPAASNVTAPLVSSALAAPIIRDAPDGDLLGQIGARMQIPREVSELVYDIEDGKFGVVLSARRLAPDKSGAARQLAQIVAAGRQAAGMEEWTPVGAIRAVVSDYGRLDSSNFAASLQSLDDVFLFRGKGAGREVKVTRPGMESIADLIKSLAGAES